MGFPYDYSTPIPPNVYVNAYIAALDPNSMSWSSEPAFAPLGADGFIYSIASAKLVEVVEVPAPSTLLLFVAGCLAALRRSNR